MQKEKREKNSHNPLFHIRSPSASLPMQRGFALSLLLIFIYFFFLAVRTPLTQLLRFILVFLANQRFVFLICFTVFYKF